jgi:hypothetical protein
MAQRLTMLERLTINALWRALTRHDPWHVRETTRHVGATGETPAAHAVGVGRPRRSPSMSTTVTETSPYELSSSRRPRRARPLIKMPDGTLKLGPIPERTPESVARLGVTVAEIEPDRLAGVREPYMVLLHRMLYDAVLSRRSPEQRAAIAAALDPTAGLPEPYVWRRPRGRPALRRRDDEPAITDDVLEFLLELAGLALVYDARRRLVIVGPYRGKRRTKSRVRVGVKDHNGRPI